MSSKDGDFSEQLRRLNNLLERVTIRQKNGKLYLRGRRADTFPPKPGETESRRVEVALDCYATPVDLKVAKLKAQEIDNKLLWGKFDWKETPWISNRRGSGTCKQWVEKFQEYYWEINEKTLSREASFGVNKLPFLQALPQDQPMSLSLMRETVTTRTSAGKSTRRNYCITYRLLAKFLMTKGEITPEEFDSFRKEMNVLGAYKSNPVDPDCLPTDAEIIEIWRGIPNEGWQWAYGMMAVYGLRPHEVFRLETDRITRNAETVLVLGDSKTGAREVYPCPATWRERFELWNVKLPNIRLEGRGNVDIGARVSGLLRRYIPHKPYALRHAYCIRLGMMNVPDAIAARWAGHSIKERIETYQQAIKRTHQLQAFENMKRLEKEQMRDLLPERELNVSVATPDEIEKGV